MNTGYMAKIVKDGDYYLIDLEFTKIPLVKKEGETIRVWYWKGPGEYFIIKDHIKNLLRDLRAAKKFHERFASENQIEVLIDEKMKIKRMRRHGKRKLWCSNENPPEGNWIVLKDKYPEVMKEIEWRWRLTDKDFVVATVRRLVSIAADLYADIYNPGGNRFFKKTLTEHIEELRCLGYLGKTRPNVYVIGQYSNK